MKCYLCPIIVVGSGINKPITRVIDILYPKVAALLAMKANWLQLFKSSYIAFYYS